MPLSWFDFRIFIRVSNRIFLKFFVQVSSFSRIKPFNFRGSTVYGIYCKWNIIMLVCFVFISVLIRFNYSVFLLCVSTSFMCSVLIVNTLCHYNMHHLMTNLLVYIVHWEAVGLSSVICVACFELMYQTRVYFFLCTCHYFFF
jgi:hypothetical protein